ncbi:flavin reductase family protein [Aquimarina hainanensis]|uniref:Flavin reductase family protein n=1 Tax=Aquimarina hainanensis TaxID=1578017 RepID=A0ABW5NA60_9FLAO|nr:flavin reductase [Aquimarina sp. TRL1]QKX07032.1 flavin reductase [Aquimarina sp. TRL1]
MKKKISRAEIDAMEHLYKINLINSCSGFKSANLIGSVAANGDTNVAVFSSVVHLGSNPPLLGMIFRPLTVPRNTYDNIKEGSYYTINHIHKPLIEAAHHTSAKYPKEISEFDKTNLTPEYKSGCMLPFVAGAPVQMLMKYVEEYTIKSNDTILLVGEIKELFVNEELLTDEGFIDLSKAQVATINGLDGYAIPEKSKRLPYQRVKVN